MTDSDASRHPIAARRPSVALLVALPLLFFSGLFTSWGGAVRWKDCWLVAPWECSTHDDAYGLYPSGYENYVGSPGAAEPLAIGSLLAFMAVCALVVSTRPRWAAVLVIVLATPLLTGAYHYWLLATSPQDVAEGWRVGVLTPVFIPVFFFFFFGGLVLVAGLVALLRPVTEPRWKPAERSAWVCVALVGWGHSVWGWYGVPQILANSHDDPTWMDTLTGVVTVGAALLLAWSLGRASAETRAQPQTLTPTSASTA